MNQTVLNLIKGTGAALAIGTVGVTAYKAVQHFTGNNNSAETTNTDTSDVATQATQSTAEPTTLQVNKLIEYPNFVNKTFPNLEIREGEVFEHNGVNFLLIEGTDNKMSPRPQAILFKLDSGMYSMIQSVTINGKTVSYGTKENLGVSIAYENKGNVQAFVGSAKDQPIENFNNDFVLALD
jgi:hypothetical protein